MEVKECKNCGIEFWLLGDTSDRQYCDDCDTSGKAIEVKNTDVYFAVLHIWPNADDTETSSDWLQMSYKEPEFVSTLNAGCLWAFREDAEFWRDDKDEDGIRKIVEFTFDELIELGVIEGFEEIS